MPHRHGKPERNLEAELDQLLSQIKRSVPDLKTSVLDGISPQAAGQATVKAEKGSRQVIASQAEAATVSRVTVPAIPPPAAPAASPAATATTTQDEIEQLLAAARAELPLETDQTVPSSEDESDESVNASDFVSPDELLATTTSANAAATSVSDSPTALTEDALAAQIQGLLDNAQRHLDAPVVSQPAPANPAENEPEQDLGDFASPQEILDQTAMPAPTHVEPHEQGIEASATEQDRASVTKITPAPADAKQASTPGDDAEVARILEQIDDDLSKKADEAVSGEFETVLDVVGSPKNAAGQGSSTSDESNQASSDYATAEQVAAELDSQPDANTNASDHAATPIPAIPDEAMAKAATSAPAPASPQAAQPKSSISKAAANSAPADASATKRKLSLRLPSPLPTLRAVLTLLNAPLINANPSIRQALGLLGLGNLMLGSFWVIWLLVSRH